MSLSARTIKAERDRDIGLIDYDVGIGTGVLLEDNISAVVDGSSLAVSGPLNPDLHVPSLLIPVNVPHNKTLAERSIHVPENIHLLGGTVAANEEIEVPGSMIAVPPESGISCRNNVGHRIEIRSSRSDHTQVLLQGAGDINVWPGTRSEYIEIRPLEKSDDRNAAVKLESQTDKGAGGEGLEVESDMVQEREELMGNYKPDSGSRFLSLCRGIEVDLQTPEGEHTIMAENSPSEQYWGAAFDAYKQMHLEGQDSMIIDVRERSVDTNDVLAAVNIASEKEAEKKNNKRSKGKNISIHDSKSEEQTVPGKNIRCTIQGKHKRKVMEKVNLNRRKPTVTEKTKHVIELRLRLRSGKTNASLKNLEKQSKMNRRKTSAEGSSTKFGQRPKIPNRRSYSANKSRAKANNAKEQNDVKTVTQKTKAKVGQTKIKSRMRQSKTKRNVTKNTTPIKKFLQRSTSKGRKQSSSGKRVSNKDASNRNPQCSKAAKDDNSDEVKAIKGTGKTQTIDTKRSEDDTIKSDSNRKRSQTSSSKKEEGKRMKLGSDKNVEKSERTKCSDKERVEIGKGKKRSRKVLSNNNMKRKRIKLENKKDVKSDEETAVKEEGQDKQKSSGEENKKIVKEDIKCEHCEKKFRYISKYRSHLVSHGISVKVECRECSAWFSDRKSVLEHQLSDHDYTGTEKRVYDCIICKKTFMGKYNLIYHQLTHLAKGKQPYKCEICEKTFGLPSRLKAHQRCHTGEKCYFCEVCGRGFNNESNCRKHKRVHSDETPYTCSNCGKKFKSSGSLKVHMESVHIGTKNFQCEICSKTFTQLSHLKSHNRYTHDKSLPDFLCNVCGKDFKFNRNLKLHLLSHTGERNFKCTVCGKAFSRADNLKVHTRIHTGERRYKCDVCEKTFIQSGDLTKHLRIHTGSQPYQCQICGQQFKQQSNLLSHERKSCEIGTCRRRKKKLHRQNNDQHFIKEIVGGNLIEQEAHISSVLEETVAKDKNIQRKTKVKGKKLKLVLNKLKRRACGKVREEKSTSDTEKEKSNMTDEQRDVETSAAASDEETELKIDEQIEGPEEKTTQTGLPVPTEGDVTAVEAVVDASRADIEEEVGSGSGGAQTVYKVEAEIKEDDGGSKCKLTDTVSYFVNVGKDQSDAGEAGGLKAVHEVVSSHIGENYSASNAKEDQLVGESKGISSQESTDTVYHEQSQEDLPSNMVLMEVVEVAAPLEMKQWEDVF